ncbi:MAG: repeat-containing protein [Bacteroidetes bacterium]|jgi:PKD repeat protein|nr:repeat-containing protein [Bacteroidota bacterium]
MKTVITQLRDTMKLKWVFMLAALLSLGFKANAQCAANFNYSVDTANNGNVAFTNTSSAAPGSYYEWSFGDGGYAYTTSPSYTYMTTSTYNVCLTVIDTLSPCNDSICHTIAVTNSSPGGSCSAAFTPTFDTSNYVHFNNMSTGSGLTSTWTFGDGTSGTSTGDVTHYYSSPGTYYICLSVTNFLGTCTDSYCDSIYFNPSSSGMCMGSVNSYFTSYNSAGVTYFNNTPSGTGPVYFWDFGDGSNTNTVGNTSHTYTSPGTYTVCLTVYETGGTYDSCQYCSYVTIGAPAGPCDASFTVIQDSSNLYNYFVYNNTTSSSPTMTYFWDFGDGTTSTLQYPSHTYPDTVSYYLCLTVADSTPMIMCTSTYCDTIAAGRSSSGITVTVVNTATGISEAAIASTLENYPNPFSGSTTIHYSIAKDAIVELNVFDLLGNKIATIESGRRSSGNYSEVWNADNVAGGMYLLQMKVNNQVSTKKIILNK